MAGTTSRRPITAVVSSGYRLSSPSRAIARPPTPVKRTRPGANALRPAISCAPSASPDGSPHTSIKFIFDACASAAFTA